MDEFYRYKEKIIHGNHLLPFQFYIASEPARLHKKYWHWHTEFEIFLLTKGHITFQINNENFTLKKGDIIIIPPNRLHCIKEIHTDFISYQSLVFSVQALSLMNGDAVQQNYINPLTEDFVQFTTLIDTNHSAYKKLVTHLDQLLAHYIHRKTGFELMLKGQLYLLLGTLFQNDIIHVKKWPNHDKKNHSIQQITTFIQNSFHQKMTVSELAQSSGYSMYHFIRLFKAYTGFTPNQYLNNIRLNHAMYLLSSTQENVTSISIQAGFESPAYFTKLFKEQFGQTPSNCRKNLQNQNT